VPDTRRFGSRGEATPETGATTLKQAAAPRPAAGSPSPAVVAPVSGRPRESTPPGAAEVALAGPVVERYRKESSGLPKRVMDMPDVTSIEPAQSFAASGDGRAVPDWGAVGDARKTVMMTAAPRESPLAQVMEPPKIEVVQHEMPDDGPLDRRLVLVRDSDSARAAAFRVLRHHILERGQPKVVAVSSASDREGKTSCAVNLALAMAECGRGRVLLIDGNLRRPELAGIFRFVPPWCFAEQLQVHREQPLLPWGVVEVRSMWLHVAAINPRRDPGKVRDAPSFGIALERLRLGPYDHIVIDCPSVLGSADVNLIQDAADGVLLVARKRQTTVRVMRRAIEQLTPTKVLGTALLE
jgi:Mrp family chromosome partitioning ATPase